MREAEPCKGCSATVRLAPGEVQRLLAQYLQSYPGDVVDDATYAQRLAVCRGCTDRVYGTTCKHCGCLIEVRAKLAGKSCPASVAKWDRVEAM